MSSRFLRSTSRTGSLRVCEDVQDAENGQAKITVYNTRANMTREVHVSLSKSLYNMWQVTVMPRKWAGNGLLGATVRYDAVDVVRS